MPAPDPELIDDENPEWTDEMFAFGSRRGESLQTPACRLVWIFHRREAPLPSRISQRRVRDCQRCVPIWQTDH